MKHTPGPWAIEDDHDDAETIPSVLIHGQADAPGLVHVALVYTIDAFGEYDYADEREMQDVECKANAALIAAAPDLLAACAKALSLAEQRDRGEIFEGVMLGEIQDILSDAIKKAEGNNGH